MRSDRVFMHDHTDRLQAVSDSGFATSMKQLGAGNLQATVSQLFPALPRDHPCSTVPAAHWIFGKSSAYLRKTSESIHLELRECDMLATVSNV